VRSLAYIDSITHRNRRVSRRDPPISRGRGLAVLLINLVSLAGGLICELPIDSNRPIDLINAGCQRLQGI
jgi:hypothetical protein